MDSRAVVASFLACWRVQDLEMSLGHLSPDVVYTLHNGPDAEPFSGSHQGIEACRELGYKVLAAFDYLDYDPTIVNAGTTVVQVHVRFRIRHRDSGHVIEGTQRSVFRVSGGRIVSIDIFEDSARIEAFIQLLTHREVITNPRASVDGLHDTATEAGTMLERVFGRVAQRAPGRR